MKSKNFSYLNLLLSLLFIGIALFIVFSIIVASYYISDYSMQIYNIEESYKLASISYEEINLIRLTYLSARANWINILIISIICLLSTITFIILFAAKILTKNNALKIAIYSLIFEYGISFLLVIANTNLLNLIYTIKMESTTIPLVNSIFPFVIYFCILCCIPFFVYLVKKELQLKKSQKTSVSNTELDK